jgi:ABC-type lipopolysaccharide export system ATPase subunit
MALKFLIVKGRGPIISQEIRMVVVAMVVLEVRSGEGIGLMGDKGRVAGELTNGNMIFIVKQTHLSTIHICSVKFKPSTTNKSNLPSTTIIPPP